MGKEINQDVIKKEAKKHAESIEAVCWTPSAQITEEEYLVLLTNKTNQVCNALIAESIASTPYPQALTRIPPIPFKNPRLPL